MDVKEHQEIIEWIRNLKFKKKFFGGVDEDDVLRKMEELTHLYEIELSNMRSNYEILLAKRGGD